MKKLVLAMLTIGCLNAHALDKNLMVRMRTLAIMPSESGTPSVVGGDVKLTDDTVPEIDFSYFFTERFALELILTTAQHKASANKTAANNLDLGEVSLLPPTLLAQYHQQFGKFKPYVGAGINYTVFYNEEPGVARSVHYDNSVGYALQVGADYEILDNVYLNFDVKKLYLSTDVEVNTYSSGTVTADVEIDPWLVGLGIGTRF